MSQRSLFVSAVLLVCAFTASGTKRDEKLGKKSNDDVLVPVPKTYYPLDGTFTNNEEANRAPKAQLHHVHLSTGPYGTTNGAYEFAGQVGSYIEFDNSGGQFDTRNSITLLCWVFPDSIDGPLFNYNKGGAYGVHLWMNGKHQIFARITKYSTHAFNDAIISDESLPLRKWAFVGTSYNSATGINALFLNGKIVKTLNISAGQEISTNDPAIRMGVRNGDGRYFKGKITKMRVYDEALSEHQVQALMDADYNPCDRHPCKHGGQCIQQHGYSFKCKCKDGYTGKICQKEEDRCESYPCRNGGTCITLPGYEFKCECSKGYQGEICESDIDECKVHNGGCQDVCVNTIGSYRCECSDPELSLAHDHYHCVAVGAEVECRQHDMVIYLPKELLYGLDREHLRLIDVHCRAKENATHFILQTGLTKCGTILKHRKGFVAYSNMVSEIPLKEHQTVTRVRQAMIQFHCYYSDWGVVSSIGIKPTSKKIVFSSKGFGSFTITLDLYRKPKYAHAFSQDDYPVMFYIRERMYFEVTVETKDRSLTIFPLDCYATPSQDKDSQPRYDAIVDGCPVDDTLEYHEAANEQSKRFSLEAFQYVSKHPYVFFHCRVKICNLTDPYSRCARGCVKDRLRRSAQTTAETTDDIYSLAQGPLTLNRDNDEPEEAEIDNEQLSQETALTTDTDIPVIAALALVIGVCVVGMSYMGWKKQHQKSMRQFIPLYEDVQK